MQACGAGIDFRATNFSTQVDRHMVLNRFILILFTLCLLSACASNPATGNHEQPQVSERQESNLGAEKQLKLKAFLNQQGNVSLRIDNHSTFNVDNILVGLRMRFSARIVSDFIYTVPEGIKAGESLVVDTDYVLPTANSIIRAEVIQAKVAP